MLSSVLATIPILSKSLVFTTSTFTPSTLLESARIICFTRLLVEDSISARIAPGKSPLDNSSLTSLGKLVSIVAATSTSSSRKSYSSSFPRLYNFALSLIFSGVAPSKYFFA